MAGQGDDVNMTKEETMKEFRDVWVALNNLGAQDISTLTAIQLLANQMKAIAIKLGDIEKSLALGKN